MAAGRARQEKGKRPDGQKEPRELAKSVAWCWQAALISQTPWGQPRWGGSGSSLLSCVGQLPVVMRPSHTRWSQAGLSPRCKCSPSSSSLSHHPTAPTSPPCLGAKSALCTPREPNPLQDICDCYKDCLPQDVLSATTLTSHTRGKEGQTHPAESSGGMDLLREGHILHVERYMSRAALPEVEGILSQRNSHWRCSLFFRSFKHPLRLMMLKMGPWTMQNYCLTASVTPKST